MEKGWEIKIIRFFITLFFWVAFFLCYLSNGATSNHSTINSWSFFSSYPVKGRIEISIST